MSRLVRKVDRERHEVIGFAYRVAEHDALVSGALLFLIMKSFTDVHALGNVGRLAIEGHHHGAGFMIETFCGIVVADFLDRFASDLRVVRASIRRDFTRDHHETRGDESFACNARTRILGKESI